PGHLRHEERHAAAGHDSAARRHRRHGHRGGRGSQGGSLGCAPPDQEIADEIGRRMSPLVAVLMGSRSDWETMSHTVETLERLEIPHEVRALSAHRTPDALTDYVADVEARGAQVFVAAAGGAAHLAGVVAAKTAKPVLGVPMQSAPLGGLDSLLSM